MADYDWNDIVITLYTYRLRILFNWWIKIKKSTIYRPLEDNTDVCVSCVLSRDYRIFSKLSNEYNM